MVQLDHARVMARMVGPRHVTGYYTSSGSEHDYARDSDRGSEISEPQSLSDLVECFLEESCRDENVEDEDREVVSGEEESTRLDSVTRLVCEEFNRIVSDRGDHYRSMLVSQVHQAIRTLPFHTHPTVLRGVMTRLRNLGHNAAVCKTKWDTSKSGNLVSGSHEFIDAVTTATCSNQLRYIIEIDFGSRFKIARPTESYNRLLEFLPKAAIVATEEEMRRIVKLMSDEAKRSLMSRDMHLPPWRKNRYMQMKWFGPYKRTTNASLPGGTQSGLGGGRWSVGL